MLEVLKWNRFQLVRYSFSNIVRSVDLTKAARFIFGIILFFIFTIARKKVAIQKGGWYNSFALISFPTSLLFLMKTAFKTEKINKLRERIHVLSRILLRIRVPYTDGRILFR